MFSLVVGLCILVLGTNSYPTSRANDPPAYDIFYMEGTMEHFVGIIPPSLIRDLNIYHGAIGVQQKNTIPPKQFVFEYFPPEFVQAVFPVIVTNATTGRKDCVWLNQAVVDVQNVFNKTIWLKISHLGEITESQFADFKAFAAEYTKYKPDYYLWTVWDHWLGKDYMDSIDCLDFVWDALQFFVDQGVALNYSAQCARDYVNIYVSDFEKADYEADHDHIIEFYQTFSFTNETLFQILIHAFEFPFEHHYVYAQGAYYRIKAHFPWVGYHYYPEPMPKPKLFPDPAVVPTPPQRRPRRSPAE